MKQNIIQPDLNYFRKTYTQEEVFEITKAYFDGEELPTTVWMSKYALKEKKGDSYVYYELTPDDSIRRTANEIYRIEQKYKNPVSLQEIYDSLEGYRYITFGGGIEYGIGNQLSNSSLGNCFAINNENDSYGGIFKIDEMAAQLEKMRGGVGMTIDHLRIKGMKVSNAAQSSTGGVSFLHRFSNTTREVAQDGRRGAAMIACHIKYPDSKEFITIKDNNDKVTGANLSIKACDEFMNAVETDQPFILRFPVDAKITLEDLHIAQKSLEDSGSSENLFDGEVHEVLGVQTRVINAKEYWMLMMTMAWKRAEPGVLFWDRIINESPADCYPGFRTITTNPCGEVPLCPFDSCRLASLSIFGFIVNPFSENAYLDIEKLERYARLIQRYMDDVMDLEGEKIDKIITKIKNDKSDDFTKSTELFLWNSVKEVLGKGRRTGVGMLGLADAMAALNIKYGTVEATEFATKIAKTIAKGCYTESISLAKERGAFPIWNDELEKDNDFIKRINETVLDPETAKDHHTFGRRNIACLSIAPTGTRAITGLVTSGIEPVFKCFYMRRRKVNPDDINARVDFVDEVGDSFEEYPVVHYLFGKWCIDNGHPEYNTYSSEKLQNVVDMSPWGGAESHNIDPLEKIIMQGQVQLYVDHSISITHNLSEDTSVEVVSELYMAAWKAGCKGCTVYRDGSRSGVLVTNTKKKPVAIEFMTHNAPKRPKKLDADFYFAKSKGQSFGVIVGKLNDRPYELFAFNNPVITKSKTSGTIVKVSKGVYNFVENETGIVIENLQLAASCVEEKTHTFYISMCLRHGIPIEFICDITQKMDGTVSNFSSVCRRILSKYIETEGISGEKCPECGSELIRVEGCVKCKKTLTGECIYSKCG